MVSSISKNEKKGKIKIIQGAHALSHLISKKTGVEDLGYIFLSLFANEKPPLETVHLGYGRTIMHLFGINHKPHQESVTSRHCDFTWV